VNIHEKYISRCIELGKLGIGNTYPNPSVGCCIVLDDEIIGEGYTSKAGGNHAEVNAINSVEDKSLLKLSTIYVTLEPCCHHGKTPPCVDKIIASGMKKVVIGIKDPNPLVCGKGIEKLKENGIEVISGVLKKECIEHHKRFLSFIINKRPYIILKWAETADGHIAPKQKDINEPYWISNSKSRELVHKWRSKEQAILVGAQTIREDDPRLTTRDCEGKNCDIYILSKKGLKKDYKIFNQDSKVTVLDDKEINFNKNIAKQICDKLYDDKILSVIIEGGTKTLSNFIDYDMWDEMRVFKTQEILGDGVKGPKIKFNVKRKVEIENDIVEYYLNNGITFSSI
jgi:diaminohydroxyphosphoribosylaminopyrimidine deaminase/5-amino-6-(5-phosphoribosylamino)uracil reductase